MKNTILSICLLAGLLGFSQNDPGPSYQSGPYYLSELVTSPGGADRPVEYIELRGPASTTITDDLWLIVIEGDGESGKTDMGKVKESIDLKGLSFGSNGYLVIVANINGLLDPALNPNSIALGMNTNPYATLLANSDAEVITIELEGVAEAESDDPDALRRFNDVTVTSMNGIGFDGNLNDQSATYMLINSATDPKDVDVDGEDGNPHDGIFDATGDHTSWIIYDSYSILDNDDFPGNSSSPNDIGEFGYGQIIFAENYTTNEANFFFPTGTPVFSVNNDSQYVARQGVSTGYMQDDWVATRINSGTAPNWKFGSSPDDSSPAAFAGYTLLDSTIGGENASLQTLSITEQELTEDISFFPNPTNNIINIRSKNDIITAIEVINVTGQVLIQNEDKNALNVVDISSLSNGMYLMNIYANNAKITKSILKK